MQYIDVTDIYITNKKYQLKKQKYFITDDGIKHNVDGKHVVFSPSKREIEVANILGKALGGKVHIIPRINEPEGIKTPDYIINDRKFDLKKLKERVKIRFIMR